MFSVITDLSFQRILYQLVGAVVIIATHGYGLSLMARLLGDNGPRYDGRLTLNPFAHAEPLGALSLILLQAGWVRPITLDVTQMRGGAAGPLIVAFAALFLTLVLGMAFWQLRPVAFSVLGGTTIGITTVGLLEMTARMSLAFTLLNLIPILPLSAGHALVGFFPAAVGFLRRYQTVIAALFVLALLAGGSLFLRQILQSLYPIVFR